MLYGAPTARRQDAQRNRAAIVLAASEVMAGGGSAVPMPEIARRAGVGQATLYRHFPDRSALAAAVITHHLQRLEAFVATEACRPAVFQLLLREVLHSLVAMRPLVLLARRFDPGARERYQKRLVAAFCEPLRRAQREGYVHGDVAPEDLLVLLAMVQGVAEATGDLADTEAAAARSIDLVLNGIFRSRAG
ncbi:TetR/AcrR family transcriptional regulator [Actinoplanes sp. NPDC049599]|uniref:TetR/AcrR family transcriptional regulator n=1 Tax=Actinoplanes sp. NPDC049599 TaxID=3363903 RepID=UPI00378E94EA